MADFPHEVFARPAKGVKSCVFDGVVVHKNDTLTITLQSRGIALIVANYLDRKPEWADVELHEVHHRRVTERTRIPLEEIHSESERRQ